MGGPGSGKSRGEDYETFSRSGIGAIDGTIRVFFAAGAFFLGGGCERAPSCRRAATQGVNTEKFDDKSKHNHSYLQSPGGLETLRRHADCTAPADGAWKSGFAMIVPAMTARKCLPQSFPQLDGTKVRGKGPRQTGIWAPSSPNAEWLIFIDDDCVPREGYIGSYLNAFESADQAAYSTG